MGNEWIKGFIGGNEKLGNGSTEKPGTVGILTGCNGGNVKPGEVVTPGNGGNVSGGFTLGSVTVVAGKGGIEILGIWREGRGGMTVVALSDRTQGNMKEL